jgi:hypothetical protein
MNIMDYQETVNAVNDLLTSNGEWEERYAGYTKKISKNKNSYEADRKKFHEWLPLYVYTNVGKLLVGTHEYDLRFFGQSVATIKVSGKEVLISTEGKEKSNLKYFRIENKLNDRDWIGTEAKEFRKAFKECKDSEAKSPEHHVENALLAEFRKRDKKRKKLCNIQPVRLSGMFFQMPTPLTASSKDIKYATQYGGGIDILSRVKHLDNKTNLCVMEVKDENIGVEPPTKAMEQAVAYATFIARLLRSKSGNEWYKLFGFSGNVPEQLTIDVAVVMPANDIRNDNFEEEKLEVCKNTKLKLYALYFKKDPKDPKDPYDFIGSLKDSILPPKDSMLP